MFYNQQKCDKSNEVNWSLKRISVKLMMKPFDMWKERVWCPSVGSLSMKKDYAEVVVKIEVWGSCSGENLEYHLMVFNTMYIHG
jgi:hypothetical protein